MQKELPRCADCEQVCTRGLLQKIKPYAFTLFAKSYGVEQLLDCLAENEKRGIRYHRSGITGDYDDFTDVEELIRFIKTGTRTENPTVTS